jgi:hypothetical protein
MKIVAHFVMISAAALAGLATATTASAEPNLADAWTAKAARGAITRSAKAAANDKNAPMNLDSIKPKMTIVDGPPPNSSNSWSMKAQRVVIARPANSANNGPMDIDSIKPKMTLVEGDTSGQKIAPRVVTKCWKCILK